MKIKSIADWLDNHKFVAWLIVPGSYLVVYFILKTIIGSSSPPISTRQYSSPTVSYSETVGGSVAHSSFDRGYSAKSVSPLSVLNSVSSDSPAPVSDQRMQITDTTLSMKVNDVPAALKEIQQLAEQHQGFMVSTNLEQPEEGATGFISVRVKTQQLPEFLTQVRATAAKVVAEYVSGRDITEQYTNLEERLRVLNTTKIKFESLLNSSGSISEMLEVQRELLNLQTQIDSIEGQKRYLSESAEYSMVSMNLATDEMSLPYAPVASWNAKIVFKEAVRALVLTLRGVGTIAIWAAVFSPIWIVVLIIRKLIHKKKPVLLSD